MEKNQMSEETTDSGTCDEERFEAVVIAGDPDEACIMEKRFIRKEGNKWVYQLHKLLVFTEDPDLSDYNCPLFQRMKVVEHALNAADRSGTLRML